MADTDVPNNDIVCTKDPHLQLIEQDGFVRTTTTTTTTTTTITTEAKATKTIDETESTDEGNDGNQKLTNQDDMHHQHPPQSMVMGTTTTTTTAVAAVENLSKSQINKRRRQEIRTERKKLNKEKKRQERRIQAIADGRNLEEERRIQEERTKSGNGWRQTKLQEEWLDRMAKTADVSFRICIDCAYEDQMRPKEINSLSEQIRYCYARNKRSKNPCYFSVCSLTENGETRRNLNKINGFPDQWYKRAFQCSELPLTEVFSAQEQRDKLVYLTSDSEHTLDHLEDDKIYVIGGIVDRNRLYRAAITRAESLGIATAKLPITQYLRLVTTKVLTCNHVFEILLKYREYGNDWKQAMLDVLPARKDVQPLDVNPGQQQQQQHQEKEKKDGNGNDINNK